MDREDKTMVCSWDMPMVAVQTMVERDRTPGCMFTVEDCCWYYVLFHWRTIHDLIRFGLIYAHDYGLLIDVSRNCLIGGVGCDRRSLNESRWLLLKQLGMWQNFYL